MTSPGRNPFQHLWFVPSDVPKPQATLAASIIAHGVLVQKVGAAGHAYRCATCTTVVIVGGNQA